MWSLAPPNVQDLLDDEHFGFRKTYQALESVSTLQLLAEKSAEFKRSLVVCKTDIAKAFDSVSHESILHALRFHNVDEAVIFAILREIRDNSMVLRLPDGSSTKPIAQMRGVRQRGTISPIIFVMVMNFALHGPFRDWSARGLGLTLQDNTIISAVIFADDALLLAANWDDMQVMISEFEAALRLHGLEVHGDKCCSMCNEFADAGNLNLVGHDTPSVSGSTGFTFLGTSLTLDGSFEVEIRDRIAKAWRAFWRLRSWLLRRSVSVRARLQPWRAAMRATLFWCAGSWRLPCSLGDELVRAERAMYAKIVMMPRRAEDTMWSYRERSARNLEAFLTSENHVDWYSFALLQSWSWAGHVARLPARRLANRALQSEGVLWRWAFRFLGESLGLGLGGGGYCRFLRWEHDIEQYCELALDNIWLDVANDRVQWHEHGTKLVASIRAPCIDRRLLRRT